jgi:hypothetical protein
MRCAAKALHCRVQEHRETWLTQCHEGHNDDGLMGPDMRREFRRYLDRGILAQQHLALIRARVLGG